MSAETKATLDDAIAAHFADEHDGAMLTGYVLQAQGKGFTDDDDDAKTRYLRAVAEGQSFTVTLGLVEWVRLMVHADAITPDE